MMLKQTPYIDQSIFLHCIKFMMFLIWNNWWITWISKTLIELSQNAYRTFLITHKYVYSNIIQLINPKYVTKLNSLIFFFKFYVINISFPFVQKTKQVTISICRFVIAFDSAIRYTKGYHYGKHHFCLSICL